MFRPRRAVAASAAALLATACGTAADRPADGAKRASACAAAEVKPVAIAVRDYVSKASPFPQRFLSAAGTDSGLPEEGFKVLQDKGPSFYYSGSDTSAQRKIRAKLETDGPYASLLVLFHGQTEAADGKTVVVRLAGQYIGGKHEGKRSSRATYSLSCDSTMWKIASLTADSTP